MRVCLYCARFPEEAIAVNPLGIAHLASYLVREGLAAPDEVRIVDTLDEAVAFKPDLLGISAVSQVIREATEFTRQVKKHTACVTVLGGYHITAAPHTLSDVFDLGALGEGEVTLAEIVGCLSRGQSVEQCGPSIDGVCYHAPDGVRRTADRRLVDDLDSLPWPLRHRQYSNCQGVFTSRGCPYRCVYCAAHTVWGSRVRFRSAEAVVDEIDHLVSTYHPAEIAILDDLWMANPRRFVAIVDGLVARGIPDRATFRGFCRSNAVTDETIRHLKRMNYRVVRFGAETGSERLLKRIKGDRISVADHQRVIDLCDTHGMPCSASFMFGIPGETREDIDQTVAFLRRNRYRLSVSGFYFFNPIPGTPVWDELVADGRIGEGVDFERYQLDLSNPAFSWDRCLYFNELNIPLADFRSIVDQIRDEFVRPALPPRRAAAPRAA